VDESNKSRFNYARLCILLCYIRIHKLYISQRYGNAGRAKLDFDNGRAYIILGYEIYTCINVCRVDGERKETNTKNREKRNKRKTVRTVSSTMSCARNCGAPITCICTRTGVVANFGLLSQIVVNTSYTRYAHVAVVLSSSGFTSSGRVGTLVGTRNRTTLYRVTGGKETRFLFDSCCHPYHSFHLHFVHSELDLSPTNSVYTEKKNVCTTFILQKQYIKSVRITVFVSSGSARTRIQMKKYVLSAFGRTMTKR